MQYIFRKELFIGHSQHNRIDYENNEFTRELADGLDGRVMGYEVDNQGYVVSNFIVLPEWCETVEGS